MENIYLITTPVIARTTDDRRKASYWTSRNYYWLQLAIRLNVQYINARLRTTQTGRKIRKGLHRIA